jgi:dimethylamine corrinoid protein
MILAGIDGESMIVDNSGDLIIRDIVNAVLDQDENETIQLSHEILSREMDTTQAIHQGLLRGLELAGEKYEKGEFFVPELLLASEAVSAGLKILKPHINKLSAVNPSFGVRAVIGVIEGDTHDIGKELVKHMLGNAGFHMIDLGGDVPLRDFIKSAEQEDARMICLSCMVSPATLAMRDFIELLKKEGLREKYKVMIGGASVSESYAREIGADGFAPNAVAAVRQAKSLLI